MRGHTLGKPPPAEHIMHRVPILEAILTEFVFSLALPAPSVGLKHQ